MICILGMGVLRLLCVVCLMRLIEPWDEVRATYAAQSLLYGSALLGLIPEEVLALGLLLSGGLG